MIEKEIAGYEGKILERCKTKIYKMISYLCYSRALRKDIFAEAQKALLEAIQSFDAAKARAGIPCDIDSLEKAIWSYAYMRIKGTVIEVTIERLYNIKRYRQNQLRIIQQIHDEIMQEKQSYVTAQEIAQRVQEQRARIFAQAKNPGHWLPKKYERSEEVQAALDKLMHPFMALYNMEPMTIEELEEEEDWQIALEILEAFPLKLCRLILQKKFLQDKSYPKIAQELKITEDQVRYNLGKSLRILRKFCQQYSWQTRLNICRSILTALSEVDSSSGLDSSTHSPHDGGNQHED